MIDPMLYHPEPNCGCWLWAKSLSGEGYGNAWDGKTVVKAHRWVYEQEVGPIPEGCDLHHLCGVRSCVNPTHLRPLSRSQHRWAHVKEMCVNGHEWNDENTYYRPDNGKRACRACKRERMRKYKSARPG